MSSNQKSLHLKIRKTGLSTGIVWVMVYFAPLAKEVFRGIRKLE